MVRTILFAVALLAARPLGAETLLIMFDQPGCSWCARWTDEVGGEYPVTDEGQIAPLHRQGISETLPDGIDIDGRPVFTPTFVLVHDGAEVGRIEGYPGEDFFWGLLGSLIAELPEDAREDPET